VKAAALATPLGRQAVAFNLLGIVKSNALPIDLSDSEHTLLQ